jgi:hypothetical protein
VVAVLNSNRVRFSSGVRKILIRAPIEYHQVAGFSFIHLYIICFFAADLLNCHATALFALLQPDKNKTPISKVIAKLIRKKTTNFTSLKEGAFKSNLDSLKRNIYVFKQKPVANIF